jgi:transposase InsO family protein
MSRAGCPDDNARAEAFVGTPKTEFVHRHSFRARAQARRVIFDWIETFHSPRRRHGTNGHFPLWTSGNHAIKLPSGSKPLPEKSEQTQNEDVDPMNLPQGAPFVPHADPSLPGG